MDDLQTLKKAISLMGGVVSAARILGIPNYQTIQQWPKCPAEYCAAIEEALNGAVTCEQLRSDMARTWAYLRETKKAA